jgi:hypothetical protein
MRFDMKNKFTFSSTILVLFLLLSSTMIGQGISLTTADATIGEDGVSLDLTFASDNALTTAADVTVTITYTGTATNGGTDYTASTSVVLPTSTTTTATNTVSVLTAADTFLEGDETIIATITSVVGGNGSPAIDGVNFSTTLTITDAETISLSGTTSIFETGGSATLTATISGGGILDLSSSGALTLDVAFTGTATNTTDYANVASFTILDGQPSGTFDITSVSDISVETDETVIATISTLVPGIAFTVNNQTVTILDDDFLTAPVNGLTGVSVEPTFTWITPNTGGATYEVKISTAGNNQVAFNASVIATETGIVGLTYSFTEEHLSGAFPLNNNTKYYWQVTPTGGPASEIFHFTTVPSVPITLSLPNNNDTVNMTDITFYYYVYGTFGNMQYKIQVEEYAGHVPTAAEWDNVIANHDFEAITTVGNKLFTLHEGTKYYWRVILLDENDGVINYSSVRNFTTGGGTPVTPILSWPLGVTVLTNTPTVYWSTDSFAGALEYQVSYSVDNTDATSDGELDNGVHFPLDANMAANGSTDLNMTLPTLLSGQKYYWQVRVYDATTTEYGDWSSIGNFTTHGSGTLVKPILSYPIGNVTVYTTAPTLYWYVPEVSDGLTYDVYYKKSTDVGYTGPVHQDVDWNFQLTGLEAGKTYNWYVEANNSTTTLASDVSTFTITGGVANGEAVITWPLANPTVYTTKPTIYWFIDGSTLGITGVELRVKEGSNSANWSAEAVGTQVALPDLSYTFTSDLTEGSTYYFAVATFYGSIYSTWDEGSFTVYDSESTVTDPVLTSPIGGISLASDSPTLYWYVTGDLSSVDYYEVTYSKSDVWESSVTATVQVVDDFYLALTNLTPGATYYWRVRTHFTSGSFSNHSDTETFVVNPGANAIQPLVGGPNNIVVTTTAPTLSWVFPADHVSTLTSELLISDNPDMIGATSIENIASTSYDVSGLEKGKSYFWKVRTKTVDNTYSEYSGQGTFKVGDNVTAVEEPTIIPEKFEVSQNYPNPFNPSTVISYSLPTAEFVTIKVYNMLGQEIATLLNKDVNAGVYNITWNGVDNSGSKVSTGTYIFRVVAGDNVVSKKMILLK